MYTDRVMIGSKPYCYKDLGLKTLYEAASACSNYNESWLLVPKNEQENDEFKALIDKRELGISYGVALGLQTTNGLHFVDSDRHEINYRIGTFFRL